MFDLIEHHCLSDLWASSHLLTVFIRRQHGTNCWYQINSWRWDFCLFLRT